MLQLKKTNPPPQLGINTVFSYILKYDGSSLMAKLTVTDQMCQFCLPHKQIKAEILPFLRMNRNSSRDGASIVYKRYVHIRRLASINHMFQLDCIYDTLLF